MYRNAHCQPLRFMIIQPCTLCIFALFMLAHTQIALGQQPQRNSGKYVDKIVQARKRTAQGTIYFVPIIVDTFVPVYPNTIKQNADKVISLDADGLAIFYHIISGTYGRGTFDSTAFYRTINDKKAIGTFDTTHVRLRLDDGKEPPLFVDQQGIVLYKNAKYSLTPFAFVQLDHFVASLSDHK